MKKKGLVTFLMATVAATSLGGCAMLMSGLRGGYTIQNNGISVPKRTKNAITKIAKGDYELKTSQYPTGEWFISNVPHPGDWNNDGEFDWEMVAKWGDRNKDGKNDFIKISLIESVGGNVIKSNILLVDDNFDGYIDRQLFDVINKQGKNNPDGIYDYEEIVSKLYGFNNSKAKSKHLNIDYWINDLLPLYLRNFSK